MVGVTTLQLEGIEQDYVLPLACQFLEVKAIPAGVEKYLTTSNIMQADVYAITNFTFRCFRILREKCEGNPSLVEVLLQELLRTEKIEIIQADAPAVRILRATLKYCDPKYIARSRFAPSVFKSVA